MNVQHILVSTILLIYHMHHVYGYGLGAPDSKCGPASMEPDHGLAIQTTDIPYTLTSTTSTYTSGVSHTLTLSGESGAVFRGFLIQGEAGDGTVVGTMVAVAGTKTLTCGSVGNGGITHSAKNDKSTIAFNWIGPDVSNGPITFKVTVVKDYATYWVKKDLLTLTPPDSPVASPLTTTTVSPQTTKLTPVTTQPTIQVTVNTITTTTDMFSVTKKPGFTNYDSTNYKDITSEYTPSIPFNGGAPLPFVTYTPFKTEDKHTTTITNNYTDVTHKRSNLIDANITLTADTFDISNRIDAVLERTTTKLNTIKGNFYADVNSSIVPNIVNISATLASTATRRPLLSASTSSSFTVSSQSSRGVNDYNQNSYKLDNTNSSFEISNSQMVDSNVSTSGQVLNFESILSASDIQTSNITDIYKPFVNMLDINKYDKDQKLDSLTTTTSFTNIIQTIPVSQAPLINVHETLSNISNTVFNTNETIYAQPELVLNESSANLLEQLNKMNITNEADNKYSSHLDVSLNKMVSHENETAVLNRQTTIPSKFETTSPTRLTNQVEETTKQNIMNTTNPFNKVSSIDIVATQATHNGVARENRSTISELTKTSSSTVNPSPADIGSTKPSMYKPVSSPVPSQVVDVYLNKELLSNQSVNIVNQQNSTTVQTVSATTKVSATDATNNIVLQNTTDTSAIITVSTTIPSKRKIHDTKARNKVDNEFIAMEVRERNQKHLDPWTLPVPKSAGLVSHVTNIKTPRTTRPIPVPVAPVTVAPVTTKVNTASPPTPQKTTRTQTSSSPPPETDTQEVDTIKEPKTVFIKKNGEIPYDLACGSTKGCFVKCTGNNCEFLVTWEDRGNTVRFEVYGKPDPSLASSWVAVGFSTDTKMGGDSVTECVFNNGRVTAINSYNQGFANFPIGQVGLSNIYGTYTFGVLYCSFERLKATSNNPQQFFNLENDYNIMFAKGRATEFANIRIIKHTQLPQVSANRVDYQSFAVIGSGAKFPLVKAHGCLMVIAWVMFTGIGIVAARYYKSVWADKTFMKLKIWFQIHRACMVLAVLINSIAFILIFVEVGRYSQIADIPGKSYLKSHPVLGIIVTILSLTNPIMAIFRCGGEDAKRAIFNWAHWAVGMSAYILSAICICFGFQLQKSQTPDYAVYIMIVYVLYIILFDIVFEVYECMDRKQKTTKSEVDTPVYDNSVSVTSVYDEIGKVDSVEMTNTNGTTDNGVSNGNLQTKKKMRKNDRIKTMLLAFHIAFTGAFALILVLVIALN